MNINAAASTHYETLGLARSCSSTQVRDAYRQLAKRYHPDLNQRAADSHARIQALNLAYEILSDPARRRAYDRELDLASQATARARGAKTERNLRQEVRLRIEDFLKGASVNVQVRDPASPKGTETYRLRIPPGTAPGTRFRVPRTAASDGGFVEVRVKPLPGFRFKVRGSDLRCDLRISAQRAALGGVETIERPGGGALRVQIPPKVKRGEVIRLPNEGMPRARGGHGDLLVRVIYRAEVRVTRSR